MLTTANITHGTYRLAGYDLRAASALRRDARRAQRWLETVSRGRTWEGLPPSPRPMARPVLMDSQGNRFVVSLTRDGMTSLRPYPHDARTAAGLSGGFVALSDGLAESGGPAINIPPGLAATLRDAVHAEFAAFGQGDDASAEAEGSSFWSSHGKGSQIAQGVAMQGFASVLQSGSSIGAFGGLSMSGLLGGLASIGSSTLIGMGFDKIAGLAMSAWAVDDESSTGEHLAHMATQKLMGELQSHAQSALMEAVLSPSSPAAPGSDASTLDQAREYVMGKARSSGIAIAHNTSPTDHSGVLTATAAKTLAGGLTVGRLNDVQACPLFNGSTPHVGGPVNTANPTVIAEGLAVTGEDHTALCTGVGGQTLLKPTVQNVRIGTTGMPVAISSMGEGDDAAKVEAQKASDQSNNENPSEQASDETAAQSSEGAADEDHALGCDPEHQSCEPPAEDGQMCQATADDGQMCEDPNGASAAQSQTPEQQIESAKQEAGELADGSVSELELAKGGDPEAQERVSRHFKLDPNDPKYDAKVDQLIKDYEIGKSKIDSGNYVVDNGLSGGPAGAQVSCNIWGCGDEVRINPDSLGKGSDELGGSILHENMHRAGKVPWKWDWSKGLWVNNEVYYKPSGTFPGDSYNAARKQATTYDRFARDVAKNRR